MQVTFFQQGTIPCVSKDGRFIMETPYRVGDFSLWNFFFQMILQSQSSNLMHTFKLQYCESILQAYTDTLLLLMKV